MKLVVTAAQSTELVKMLAVATLAGDFARARRTLKPRLNGKASLEFSDVEVNLLLLLDARVERPELVDETVGPFFDRVKDLVKKLNVTRAAEKAKTDLEAKKKAAVKAAKKNAIHTARRSSQRRKVTRKKKQR